MLMVNYLFCHAISSLMKTSIWIRPRQLSYRRMVYDELKNDPEKLEEIKEKIFLPSKAYPRRRGRKPKYDHLLISIEGITEEEARRVEDFAKEYFHRPVVSYKVKIQSPEGMKEMYRFLLPWRDPSTGKSIRTGKGVFMEMREKIKGAIRGESPEAHAEAIPVEAPQSPGSITHDMANTEELGDLALAEKPEAPHGERVIITGAWAKEEGPKEKSTSPGSKGVDISEELEEIAKITGEVDEMDKLKDLIYETLKMAYRQEELKEEAEKLRKKANTKLLKSERVKAQNKLKKVEKEIKGLDVLIDANTQRIESLANKLKLSDEKVEELIEEQRAILEDSYY